MRAVRVDITHLENSAGLPSILTPCNLTHSITPRQRDALNPGSGDSSEFVHLIRCRPYIHTKHINQSNGGGISCHRNDDVP